jgi:(p)ppGpp synthase/HD superfamily hydrolase
MPSPTPIPVILPADAKRLGRALAYAAEHHGGQARKGTTIPYVSHLFHVAGFVLEHGGSVDAAIAGLLHDVVEDCGITPEELEREFGAAVADIVGACTDLLEGDTPDRKSEWTVRKRRYIEHIATASSDAVLVSACDKRHNLAALIADVRRDGKRYLERFKGTPDQQVWYYRAFCDAGGPRLPAALDSELRDLAEEFAGLVRGDEE